MNVLLVSGRSPGPICGVWEHASRLAERLRALGHRATLVGPEQAPDRGAFDAVHLHYVPFLFPPRWGAGGPALAARLRRLGPLTVTFHEVRVARAASPRALLLATLQDGYARRLGRVAGALLVPTRRWAGILGRADAVYAPSGSNLPADRGPGPGGSGRVGVIASTHPGRRHRLAVRAARASGLRVLGLGADLGDGLDYTGNLPAAEFAAAMSGCDLLLLPYLDGAGGRRTSLAAALQLGLPVLTTLGEDPDFDPAGAFAHVVPADEEGFVAEAARLGREGAAREALRAPARALFERELSWEVIAERVLAGYRRAGAAA